MLAEVMRSASCTSACSCEAVARGAYNYRTKKKLRYAAQAVHRSGSCF